MKRKGFEMSINVIISLVVLLVLVSISIIIVGGDAQALKTTGDSTIDIGASATLCNIGCFKCCRYSEEPSLICGTLADSTFGTNGCNCACRPNSF